MGVPWVAMIVCAAFGGLAYTSLSSSANNVFGYLANLTAGCGLLTWWGISFTVSFPIRVRLSVELAQLTWPICFLQCAVRSILQGNEGSGHRP